MADGDEDELVHRLRTAGCVFAEEEARLLLDAFGDPADREQAVRRRVDGEPLELILGWVEFCGLRLRVAPGVFVPRRRSQVLVAQAQALLDRRAGDGPATVVELCCGTGAVARSVAQGRRLRVVAADIDPAAVACANVNLAPVGGRALVGDLYRPLPEDLRGSVDVLIANAPYVPTAAIDTMPPEARLYEPRVALDGGVDGIELHRRIAADAPGWLAPGGTLVIETSVGQAESTSAAMRTAGLLVRTVHDDEIDGTAVLGTRP